MTRLLERKKVTKHTFPPSPARDTHMYTHVHTRTHAQTPAHPAVLWLPDEGVIHDCCHCFLQYISTCTSQHSNCSTICCTAHSRYSEILPEAQSTAICATLKGEECLIKYWQRLKVTFVTLLLSPCEHELNWTKYSPLLSQWKNRISVCKRKNEQ